MRKKARENKIPKRRRGLRVVKKNKKNEITKGQTIIVCHHFPCRLMAGKHSMGAYCFRIMARWNEIWKYGMKS
jgi:hypothetical protein